MIFLKSHTGRARAASAVQGQAGYDNPRENIDPHVRTKAVSTRELRTATSQIITGQRHHWRISIVNPNVVVTASTIIPICALTDAALTITKIEVSTSSTSYEATGDLKKADARIGLANAAVLQVFDTTSGVSSNTLTGAVASGKFVYLSFDGAPNALMTDLIIDVWFNYD